MLMVKIGKTQFRLAVLKISCHVPLIRGTAYCSHGMKFHVISFGSFTCNLPQISWQLLTFYLQVTVNLPSNGKQGLTEGVAQWIKILEEVRH